jgi:hypothetical protein
MAAGAVNNIFEVLDSGKTMETRKTDAAEICRLSMRLWRMIVNCKLQIGANSKAMPTLVGLSKESTPVGKKDADSDNALGLAVYNLKSIVKAILVKEKGLTHEIKHDEI